jgi:hypothetical protein
LKTAQGRINSKKGWHGSCLEPVAVEDSILHSVCMGCENKKGSADLDLLTLMLIGAGEMNRTPDLLITNELLYRLSYTG